LVTKVEAYLGSNPNRKVFTINQLRYENTNINASGTLTFDTSFVTDYLKFNTKFSILFLPDESYGQTIRVKITENLTTYVKVKFNFTDLVKIHITESGVNGSLIETDFKFIDSMSIHFVEGGALPFAPYGYDLFPYDCDVYDARFTNGFASKMIENPPGSGNYEWTDNAADWISPNKTAEPSIFVEQTQNENILGSSINEGLTIREIEVTETEYGYDVYAYDSDYYPYDTVIVFPPERLSIVFDQLKHPSGLIIRDSSPEYLITVLNKTYTGSPTLIVESLSGSQTESPVPNMFPFPQLVETMSTLSFSFTTTVPVPFRLSLE